MDKGKKKKAENKRKPQGKQKKPSRLPKILIILAATALVILGCVLLCKKIVSSQFFNIKSAELVWVDEIGVAKPENYSQLSETAAGDNIFKSDIKKIASKIISKHPEFKFVSVRRQFPDQLLLKIDVRQPVAEIDRGEFYMVDTESILISEGRIAPLKEMPIVTGMKRKPPKKVGEKYYSPRLFKALELLEEIKNSGLLETHYLSSIEVSNHRNIMFFIDEENLKIQIGHKHFAERLVHLREALSSQYINKKELKYIDLRFDDIVFGTR